MSTPAKPKAPKAASFKPETVLVKPLPEPEKAEEAPAEVSSLAELLHHLGPRTRVAQQWGNIAPRTLATRMEHPESVTLKELIELAELSGHDVLTLCQLAYQQVLNPITVPKPTRPGRPPQGAH